jgi:hypothetical protein
MTLIVKCASHGWSPEAREWSVVTREAPPLAWAIARRRIFLHPRRRTHTGTRDALGRRLRRSARAGIAGDAGERCLGETKRRRHLASDGVAAEAGRQADTRDSTLRG